MSVKMKLFFQTGDKSFKNSMKCVGYQVLGEQFVGEVAEKYRLTANRLVPQEFAPIGKTFREIQKELGFKFY